MCIEGGCGSKRRCCCRMRHRAPGSAGAYLDICSREELAGPPIAPVYGPDLEAALRRASLHFETVKWPSNANN